MARFDVYVNPGHDKKADVPFLLDVQSDFLADLGSRVVVPLRRVDRFATANFPTNLAPIFEIQGVKCFMETPKLAAVPVKILKTPLASLSEYHGSITSALDFLFQGF